MQDARSVEKRFLILNSSSNRNEKKMAHLKINSIRLKEVKMID
jgi:hypothetical protein